MTEVTTGANAQVLMAKESEYGVAPASDKFKKYVFKSCGLDGSQNLIENDDLGMGREALAPTLGRKESNSETSIQTYPTQLEYKPFSNAQGFVKVDGIDANIVSGSLSLTNNLNGLETIREDNEISSIDIGMFNATGLVSVRFKDKTLLNKATNGENIARLLEDGVLQEQFILQYEKLQKEIESEKK